MAEAHSAVAFSFSITHEGWYLNYDREVLHLVWQSGIRSWKKRVARFRVSVLTCTASAVKDSLKTMAPPNFKKRRRHHVDDVVLQYSRGKNQFYHNILARGLATDPFLVT